MKKNLLFSIAVCLTSAIPTSAQNVQPTEICGQMPHLKEMKAKDNTLEKRMSDYETILQQWITNKESSTAKESEVVITVPVCVHVLYNTVSQNITDNQVKSQVQVLNEDFGRTNPDANQTPAPWVSIAANTNVQFCLAQRDPSGNPSTGIERRQTSIPSFSANDAMKYYSQGGLDIWDPSKYLNIWVVSFGGSGLLGYGEFPTSTLSATFGVVIDYNVFGSNYTTWGSFPLYAQYDRGRTTTHEFSHCFNLFHIWGDDGTACTGSDLCNDTPNQGGPTSGCFTFPHVDGCTTSGNGIMYMNYMDYSVDGCKNLFTNNQKNRINAVLNSSPYNTLATSNGCTPVVLVSNDAGIPTVTTPNGNVCNLTFAPIVNLKNWGNNALTSCKINYKVDNNAISIYNWSGNLASLAISPVTLPNVTTTAGAHTFTCYTTLPNNIADGNPANDQTITNFTVYAGGGNLPLVEGFENVTFPPNNWALYNPDNGVSWARTTGAAKTGTASMWFNSIAYTCNGCIDIMTTPDLNFTSVTAPQMTFQVAYRMLSDPSQSPNWSDTLELDLTTDCGTTWNQIYKKYSTNLTTIVPTFSTVAFVPTQNDWRLESINLSSYSAATNVFIRFKVTSDYENNMYVDDINIFGNPTGVTTANFSDNIHLYPNPTDGTLYLSADFTKAENLKVFIYNVVGEEVGRVISNNTLGGAMTLDLHTMTNGVYFVRVSTDTQTFTQKVVLNK